MLTVTWLLQNKYIDHSNAVIETMLKRNCSLYGSKIIRTENSEGYRKDCIPIGDVEFTDAWLCFNFAKHMKPIEVPKVLRTKEFLGRDYSIVPKEKVIETAAGRPVFIKYAGKPKVFNSGLYEGALPPFCLLPEGPCVVSEWVDILSEYRVFVYNDIVEAAQPYLGDPLVFPDASLIKKMVNAYMEDKNRPTAYTLDVAVTKDGKTVILEAHPFVSCGLYGFESYRLPEMLYAGIQYYINTQ